MSPYDIVGGTLNPRSLTQFVLPKDMDSNGFGKVELEKKSAEKKVATIKCSLSKRSLSMTDWYIVRMDLKRDLVACAK